jgi:putative oxidoreductase
VRARLPPEQALDAVAKLLLRCLVAGLMLFHGLHKVASGIEGVRELLVEKGLPRLLAPGVYLGEVVAPLLMIAGLWTRPAALVFAFNMLVALALAHTDDIFRLGRHGEWPIETPFLFLVGGLVVALLGPGPYAVDREHPKT